MKELTFLLIITFAISTAFREDKRKEVDYNAEKVSSLLQNNGTVLPSNFPPEVMKSAKHTWMSPATDDENTIILYSNQEKAQEASCITTTYWFLESDSLRTSFTNKCNEKNVVMSENVVHTYQVYEKEGNTYFQFSVEADKAGGVYKVAKLEKVKYDKWVSGYEITLTKE